MAYRVQFRHGTEANLLYKFNYDLITVVLRVDNHNENKYRVYRNRIGDIIL